MKINLTFEPEFDALYEEALTEFPRLLDIDGISPRKVDVGQMSHDYFTNRLADTSVDQNANANEERSANNYQAEIVKGALKLEGYYLLWRYAKKRFDVDYANRLIKAIWLGDLYFHDASGHGIQIPYCWAYSTDKLMIEGRPYGQLQSLPPKRADSFIAQVIECTMDLSQEFAGAISPSDMLVNYSYYAKKDGLTNYEILNDLQKFVHVANNKFRISSQSPFTNISLFDRPNLEKVFGNTIFPDGSRPDFDYIMRIQKLFGEWFAKGDPATGLPYRFPIVTVNLSVNKEREIWDKDFLGWVSATNIEKGCFNIYINEGNKIATCCRLSNDFTQARADSFGNGGLNIGSHRVVTINLPRIAMLAERDKLNFFYRLESKLNEARDLLLVHREEILERRIKSGFLKFFNPLKWFNLDMMFSTIGIIGVYEMCHYMGLPIETEEGQQFAERVLKYIEQYAQETSKETGYSFNVEEIPGESTAPALAKKDAILCGNTIPLYSNQYLPLTADVDAITRIKLTGRFMKYLSGGGILHLNIQEKITNPAKMKRLIELAVKEGVEHFAINYGFGICENGHTPAVGAGKVCPLCGGKVTDWFTRIIGYFTKISSWNDTRRNVEFPNRKFK